MGFVTTSGSRIIRDRMCCTEKGRLLPPYTPPNITSTVVRGVCTNTSPTNVLYLCRSTDGGNCCGSAVLQTQYNRRGCRYTFQLCVPVRVETDDNIEKFVLIELYAQIETACSPLHLTAWPRTRHIERATPIYIISHTNPPHSTDLPRVRCSKTEAIIRACAQPMSHGGGRVRG